jgi:hypothetical protein
MSVKFDTAENVNLRRRHGDQLAAFAQERGAVEKQYEPVKKRLTGRFLEDADILDANAELNERRKALNTEARRLEGIRKALRKDPKTPWELQGMTVDELNGRCGRCLTSRLLPPAWRGVREPVIHPGQCSHDRRPDDPRGEQQSEDSAAFIPQRSFIKDDISGPKDRDADSSEGQ